MKIYIQDLVDMVIPGVSYCLKDACSPYWEAYFDWDAYPMAADMGVNKIVVGFLKAWRHEPCFRKMETHSGKEMFFFVEGTCVMPFCDIRDGKVVPGSVQMARIEPGTMLTVDAGKAHYVPVGVDDHFTAVVVSPRQDTFRVELPEAIRGVYLH